MIHIKKKDFYKFYKVKEVDLVAKKLFTLKDIEDLRKIEREKGLFEKVRLLFSYTPFIVRNPRFLFRFVFPKMSSYLGSILSSKKRQGKSKKIDIRRESPILNCITKASIASAFKPKSILEIGTYLGWGAASFRKTMPYCEVYSMNLRDDRTSNNPINPELVGSFYRKKGLNIIQIWADSTKYNYSKLPPIDVVYIDGSHKYEDVYKDLKHASKIAKKCVIMDDYVPRDSDEILFGPWNEGVVKAVDDFVANQSNVFSNVYWIKDTPYCVLVK